MDIFHGKCIKNDNIVAEVSIFTVEGVCLHAEARHGAVKWAPAARDAPIPIVLIA